MITIDMTKAKEIAHTARRNARAEQYKPLDIEATIPHLAESAEAQRAVIRTADAELQTQMDGASTADELKALMP